MPIYLDDFAVVDVEDEGSTQVTGAANLTATAYCVLNDPFRFFCDLSNTADAVTETRVYIDMSCLINGVVPAHSFIDLIYIQVGVVPQTNWADLTYSYPIVVNSGSWVDFVSSIDGVYEVKSYIDSTYVLKTFPATLGPPSAQWHVISLADQITQFHEIGSSLPLTDFTSITSGFAVGNYHHIDSGMLGPVAGFVELDSGIKELTGVHAFTELGSSLSVGNHVELSSSIADRVVTFVEVGSGFSELVHAFTELDSTILEAQPVHATCVIDCFIPEDIGVSVIPQSVSVTFDGTPVKAVTCAIRLSEGDAFWSCRLSVALSSLVGGVNVGDSFEVSAGGDLFYFEVEAYTHGERKGPDVLLTIDGVGPQAQYTSPRALPFTETWDTPRTAKAIVEELVGTVDWQIVEWTIPAYRVAAEEVEPFSLAADIVAAAGGVIDPNPDGTILVRYKHPVATNLMDGNETFEFVTQDDILGITESSNLEDYFDKVRILDVEAGDFADSMDYDEEISLLTAYPSPWTEDAFVSATRDDVTLFLQSIATKETTDLVEFIEGQGSTSLPVYSITNVEWVSLAHGGGISFDQDSTIINTTNDNTFYGIANVTYTSRVIEYKVTATNVDVSQFLLNRE